MQDRRLTGAVTPYQRTTAQPRAENARIRKARRSAKEVQRFRDYDAAAPVWQALLEKGEKKDGEKETRTDCNACGDFVAGD